MAGKDFFFYDLHPNLILSGPGAGGMSFSMDLGETLASGIIFTLNYQPTQDYEATIDFMAHDVKQSGYRRFFSSLKRKAQKIFTPEFTLLSGVHKWNDGADIPLLVESD